MLRPGAGFHSDEATGQFGNEQRKFSSIEPVPYQRAACAIASNQVELSLTDIDADGRDFHGGPPLLIDIVTLSFRGRGGPSHKW